MYSINILFYVSIVTAVQCVHMFLDKKAPPEIFLSRNRILRYDNSMRIGRMKIFTAIKETFYSINLRGISVDTLIF